MSQPPIRTITLGLAERHPLAAGTIHQAALTLQNATTRYREEGYEVQTVRLSTRSIFDDLAAWPDSAVLRYGLELQQMLDDVGLAFCSIGPAQAARLDFPLERIAIIPDIVSATTAISATVQLAMTGTVGDKLRWEAALPCARVMLRLARETGEGFGNFRFAALACVEPGGPFFPAAYHAGPASLSLGIQGASVVADALRAYRHSQDRVPNLLDVSDRLRAALVAHAAPIVALGEALAGEYGMRFGGIDLSPAPMGEDSIVAALEESGYGVFGSPGTLALASAVTTALKTTQLPTCGYCGLMLPVLEDAMLGRRWEEQAINVHQLLAYSAVCGTGLDTIPLPGDIGEEAVARLLLDVATLALRLRKPLSARLFPVQGRRAGERTGFSSPYLTNTVIR